ncbi:MAG: hypothetical protein EOM24_31285, partial [Chloroflexia bacterium]|nr:hypothetical protein [Chloroflexia bacterium]
MVMLGLVLLLSGCGFGGSTPTPTPEQTTPAPPRRTITILSPTTDATVTSPIVVTGDVTIMPFEANLNYRLFGPGGGLLAEGFFTAEAL